MDERMKILQLLEDGKISAEEAARLLEAVSRTSLRLPRPPRHLRFGVHSEAVDDVMGGVSGVLDSIPSIIRQSTRLGGRGGKKTLSVKKKPTVKLSLVGGDINLSLSEEDTIKGNLSSGVVTTRDTKDALLIKCLGGDADIQFPHLSTLAVSVVGGDVKGEVDSDCLAVKTLEGDISINLKRVENVTAKSKSGEIELTIPDDTDAKIEAYTMSGQIEFEPELEVEEQTDNRVTGKMGKGSGSLSAVNLSGNIIVKGSGQQ
jgi:DUF4097 and DUF4098 domain-containing protein YvlB